MLKCRIYRNNSKVNKVILFSYSGTTNDLLISTKNFDNNNKYIITKGELSKIVLKTNIVKDNIITYRTSNNRGKERGFLSFEGTISPSSLFLKYYFNEANIRINVDEFIKGTIEKWSTYFKNKKVIEKWG